MDRSTRSSAPPRWCRKTPKIPFPSSMMPTFWPDIAINMSLW